MAKQLISLVITVLNERRSIGRLLDSLLVQTVAPDEVVIVDGGSHDGTARVVEKFILRAPHFKIQLIKSEKLNRSEGRNRGIEKASGPIILVTDAGCRLDSQWVELMSKPFSNPEIDVVAGNYLLERSQVTVWQLVFYHLTAHHPKVGTDASYLPSSRSIGFRKDVWKEVGGYPERLNTAEDLVFAHVLKTRGFEQRNVPNAVVYWQPPAGLGRLVSTFFNYAYGDGLAGTQSPHFRKYLIKTLLLLIMLIGIWNGSLALWIVVLLGITYMWWQTIRVLAQSEYVGETFSQNLGYLHALFVSVPILFVVTLAGFWRGWVARQM